MKRFLLIASLLTGLGAWAQGLTANFSSSESMVSYYSMGWDSQEEFDTWTYQQTSSLTWHLGTCSTPFSNIDKTSTSSMVLDYSNGQNEVATSPLLEIRPNTKLEFYCYASGIYLVFGAWKLYVIENNTSKLLIDQFIWAQDNGYEGPSWEKFTVDLSAYAGKSVSFSFVYAGDYGENEAIDGFKLLQVNDSDEATININEGEQVHFMDISEGNVTNRTWTFEGGNPASSDEANPVVTYNEAGTYGVTLEVSDGNNTSTKTRQGYVVVKAQGPTARIGTPTDAYLSPFVAAFVPTNVPVQFVDESTGNPHEWQWRFYGDNTPKAITSNDQNPMVTFDKEGLYSVSLHVGNSIGTSDDALINAIQAGGEQYVWNIAPEENSTLEAIEMGWYGNYAGTNWLGMSKFAERYNAPLAPASLEKVAVYFAKTTCTSTDAPITLTISEVGSDGMPGEVLSSSVVNAGDLVWDDNMVVETLFALDKPLVLEEAFFVTIGGFPQENDDDIAILCCRRAEGEKSTTYQFVLDEDETTWGEYLDTGKWYKQNEDGISMAIAPILNYNLPTTGLAHIEQATQLIKVVSKQVFALANGVTVEVYNAGGTCITKRITDSLSLSELEHGVYIVRATLGSKTQTVKIIL